MSITEEVHTWLEGEGFPLEMRVAAAFRKAGFEVRQSDVYMDHESGKTREIDVIATDSDYLGVVVTHFVIECKSSKKPWILLSSDDALSNYKNLLAFGVLSENVLKVLASRITSEESLHALPWLSMGRRGGYALRQAFSKNLDVAYTAAISVAKACGDLAHSTDTTMPIRSFIFAFPIIVIDTPLLECTLQDDGQLQLDEVPQGEFLFTTRLPNYFGSCIRVVTEDYVQVVAQEAKDAAEWFQAGLKYEAERVMQDMKSRLR